MFAEGFLSISLEGLIGLIVTVVGIWLVVQQLRETKLASQMDGLITPSEMHKNIREEVKPLQDFADSEEFKKLDGKEAFTMIESNEKYWIGLVRMSYMFTLIGNLVYTKSLDIRLADRSFGYVIPLNWRRLEKVIKWHRIEIENENVNVWWEWLTNEFGKVKY